MWFPAHDNPLDIPKISMNTNLNEIHHNTSTYVIIEYKDMELDYMLQAKTVTSYLILDMFLVCTFCTFYFIEISLIKNRQIYYYPCYC